MAGFDVVAVKPQPDGDMDLDALRDALEEHGPTVAALMITLPSTLGLFDRNIVEIAEMVHAHGALMYGDGANMNAMLGQVKPGDLGFDVMHINLHKTFSQPHGGGGPGAGPIVVKQHLVPFLPSPHVTVDVERSADVRRPAPTSDVRPRRSHSTTPSTRSAASAPSTATSASSSAPTPTSARSAPTACARSARPPSSTPTTCRRACATPTISRTTAPACTRCCSPAEAPEGAAASKTLDIAKRMIDYGYHPPTIYFPLVVEEAMLHRADGERVERDARRLLRRHARRSPHEAESQPELLREAPHTAPLRRLDEATAARKPVLRW